MPYHHRQVVCKGWMHHDAAWSVPNVTYLQCVHKSKFLVQQGPLPDERLFHAADNRFKLVGEFRLSNGATGAQVRGQRNQS